MKSRTLPYVMCVGISFKTWGRYLYAITHDVRSLKVAYIYMSTLASTRDRQKRQVTNSLLFFRTLERHAFLQLRVFRSR